MEIAQLAAKRRSPELDVGASGATLGAHGGSTAQTWSGRSWATHAVSSVTTETRPGSVPAHRPGETPATSVLAAVAQSPTRRGCGGPADHPRRSAVCRECGAADARETR